VLIIALVLAVIGLASLVTAVVTSNEVIAWVCIAASVIGVLLLIVDALRERSRGTGGSDSDDADEQTAAFAASEPAEDYPDEETSQFPVTTDDAAYSDDTAYSNEAVGSDETEFFETSGASAEADTSAVAVDDDLPADEKSDVEDSTKRD
jgi:hypothetical protein